MSATPCYPWAPQAYSIKIPALAVDPRDPTTLRSQRAGGADTPSGIEDEIGVLGVAVFSGPVRELVKLILQALKRFSEGLLGLSDDGCCALRHCSRVGRRGAAAHLGFLSSGAAAEALPFHRQPV